MDLLLRSLLIVAAIIALVFAAYYTIKQVSSAQQVTKEQAEALVLRDLQNANPQAAVNITNVTPSEFSGSWHIVVSVIMNATSPCPSYFIYSFDYPKYQFVYRIDNTYTNRCIIYGLIPGKSYIVGSYPIAIARSYELNLSTVTTFINKYGYGRVSVHAQYFNSTKLFGENYTQVWIVNYSAIQAPYSVYAVLSQVNGTPLFTYNKTR